MIQGHEHTDIHGFTAKSHPCDTSTKTKSPKECIQDMVLLTKITSRMSEFSDPRK